MMKLRAAADWLFGAAMVCATLGVVALVCSHNHPHAPFIAIGLGCASAMLFWLRCKVRMRISKSIDTLSGAATICAILGVVALACSHKNPRARFVAVGLGGVSAALFLLRGKMQSSDRW